MIKDLLKFTVHSAVRGEEDDSPTPTPTLLVLTTQGALSFTAPHDYAGALLFLSGYLFIFLLLIKTRQLHSPNFHRTIIDPLHPESSPSGGRPPFPPLSLLKRTCLSNSTSKHAHHAQRVYSSPHRNHQNIF